MRKLADKINRVGVIGNSEKISCAGAVNQAARLISAAGRRVYSDAITAQLAGLKGVVCPDAATLTRVCLLRAGFHDADLQAAGPLLQAAGSNSAFEKQMNPPTQ